MRRFLAPPSSEALGGSDELMLLGFSDPAPAPLGTADREPSGSIGRSPGSSDDEPPSGGITGGGELFDKGELDAGISESGAAGVTTLGSIVVADDDGTAEVGQPALGDK